jgi:hypothetical protein
MAWKGNISLKAISASVYGNNFEIGVVVIHARLFDLFI